MMSMWKTSALEMQIKLIGLDSYDDKLSFLQGMRPIRIYRKKMSEVIQKHKFLNLIFFKKFLKYF